MNILTEGDVWAAEVGAHNRVKGDKKKNGIVRRKKKKKAISVVSYSCRFISLSIQTHRSPLNCFIEQ